MQYYGGKAKIAKDLASIINTEIAIKKSTTFISPFLGAANVEQYIKCENRVLSDNNPYLISMYNQLKQGTLILPDVCGKDEYLKIKADKHLFNPGLVGFIGCACGYSGKWFGTYAREARGRNYCLSGKNSILKKMKGLENARFLLLDFIHDFDAFKGYKNAVFYMDPPYKNKKLAYYSSAFNYNDFIDKVLMLYKNNTIFISEAEALLGLKPIWERAIRVDMTNKTTKKYRLDKLYKLEEGVI
jgi:site-specific DNA-adenine methylase